MTELYKYVTCMDKFFLIRKNTYNLKTFDAFDASISTNKKACCKSWSRIPGPWYPVTQDLGPPQRLKVGPGTPIKFKSVTPVPLSKFKIRTLVPPSKFKSGTSISPKRVGF